MFDRIEMLDGAKSMVKAMPKKVIKYHRDLDKFRWNQNFYDCILGVFCFCYIELDRIDDNL